jgi:RNA recognition motif-containing protein
LIVDLDTQRPKGYGYVEFLDRESLVNALAMNGESLQKRAVRVSVSEGRSSDKSRPPRNDDTKFAGNWRSRTEAREPSSVFGNARRDDSNRTAVAAAWGRRSSQDRKLSKLLMDL